MKSKALALTIFIVIFWASIARCEEKLPQLESLYQELRQYNIALLSSPDEFDAQNLLKKFRELGIDRYSKNLSEYPDDDLVWLYRSISSVLFYDIDIGLRAYLEKVFDELDRRGALQSEQIRSHYNHIIRAREFDNARAFSLKYDFMLDQPLPVVPEVVNGDYDPEIGPSLMKVLHPDLPLVRKNFELRGDVTIVIQFHPDCGPSSALMRQIALDSNWKEFISETAYLVATNLTDILQLDTFHSWNESSPFEVFFVENPADWPFIDRTSTPSFYVLRDGQEVDSFGDYSAETLAKLMEIMVEVDAEAPISR